MYNGASVTATGADAFDDVEDAEEAEEAEEAETADAIAAPEAAEAAADGPEVPDAPDVEAVTTGTDRLADAGGCGGENRKRAQSELRFQSRLFTASIWNGLGMRALSSRMRTDA